MRKKAPHGGAFFLSAAFALPIGNFLCSNEDMTLWRTLFLLIGLWIAPLANAVSGAPPPTTPSPREQACRQIRAGDLTCLSLHNSPLRTAIDLAVAACAAEYQTHNCARLESSLENRSRLVRCTPTGVCDNVQDGWIECAAEKYKFSQEMATAVLESARSLPAKIQKAPEAARALWSSLQERIAQNVAAMQACDENLHGEKALLIDAFNAQLEPALAEKYVLKDDEAAAYEKMSCFDLKENLWKRWSVYQQDYDWQVRSQLTPPPAQNTDLLQAAREIAENMKTAALCFSAVERGKILCDAAIFIGGIFATGGLTSAGAKVLGTLAERGLIAEATAARVARLAGASGQETRAALTAAPSLFTEKEAMKLASRFPPARIESATRNVERMKNGEALTLKEAEDTAEILDAVQKRGLISFHRTEPESIESILESKKMQGKASIPRIYALPQNNHSRLNTGKKMGSGVVMFQGQAASLFNNKPVTGLSSYFSNRRFHQVTPYGRLIIDDSEVVDGALVIKKAHMESLSATEWAVGVAPVALEQIGNGFWIGIGGGAIYYTTQKMKKTD